jgi:hypothetical protein
LRAVAGVNDRVEGPEGHRDNLRRFVTCVSSPA